MVKERPFLILFLVLCVVGAAQADDLTVDRRTLRVSESVTITVSLEDDFATLDDVRVPVQNLVLTGRPSISSEFSYINGSIVRRKVFRFRARATTPGPAVVGPLQLSARGKRQTLLPVSLQVLPDRAAASNDPAAVLRELVATQRDAFFVIAEADKESVYVGEQVVVTWWLYNGVNLHQWQIGSIPKLNDFWVEELDVRSVQPVTVYVGAYSMQKNPIRRVALYPLRSGTVDIGPMEIEASLVRRRSAFGGLLDRYEGSLAEISYASARMALDVKGLPAAAGAAALVGDFTLRCPNPTQKNGGPVVLDAILSGRGNVRAAAPPSFAKTPAADVQTIDGGVQVSRNGSTPVMSRRWKYLLSPRDAGKLAVPPLQLAVFSPASGAVGTLRCEATSLNVQPPSADAEAAGEDAPAGRRMIAPALRYSVPVLIAALVGVVIWLTVWPWWRTRRRLRRELLELTADPAPAAIRDAVHFRLESEGTNPQTLLRDPSERGEAYRSLRSLLDALERDRIDVGDREREIRRRLRDLLVA